MHNEPETETDYSLITPQSSSYLPQSSNYLEENYEGDSLSSCKPVSIYKPSINYNNGQDQLDIALEQERSKI